MAQDLRNLFKNEKENLSGHKVPSGHQQRFLDRLEEQLPKEKSTSKSGFYWMKIAAILIVVISVGFLTYQQLDLSKQSPAQEVVNTNNDDKSSKTEESPVYLSDISPEYKKIEDYYLANINAELAQLTITEKNKELIDSFMEQLSELDKEYKKLNAELNDTGVNEQTVSSLINNLELRLELLYKLKNKLTEIKKSSLEETQSNKI